MVELNKIYADDLMKRPTFAAAPIYTQVVHKVSSNALTLVHEHHASTYQCDSNFRLTKGLPCQHSAQKGINADEPFTLKDFESHWWLEKFTPTSAAGDVKSNVRIDDLVPHLFQVLNQHQLIRKLLFEPTSLIQY